MTSPRRSSESLFARSEDARRSLEKARERIRAERRRRLAAFRRVGLPLCVLGALLAACLLRAPLVSLFRKDPLVRKDIEAAGSAGGREEEPSSASRQVVGRPGARLRIECRLPGGMGEGGPLAAVLQEAVDVKPSEICLVLDGSPQGEDYLRINGREEYSLPGGGSGGGARRVVLDSRLDAADLRLVLNAAHAEVYGPNVLCPLHLAPSPRERRLRREAELEALPRFVGSEKDRRDGSQTVLPLPRADTGVVPPRRTGGGR